MIKPKALTSISFFFPCYNEEANVAVMIEQAVKVGEDYGVDYEVIVVDDGSSDRSAAIVSQWSAKNPRVRLVKHPHNMGYGAALRTGLKSCAKDLVFLTDGDNQFQIADIEKLFSKIDSCDVVTGYRIDRQDKSYRRLNGFLWTKLNRALFDLPVRDVDCAFKLFRRKALENLELKSNHLLIHAEILARLRKKGARIQEIGVTHHPRTAGKATATAPGAIFKTFRELSKLYWQIR
ncbi:MAG: glycosyltransferase family 2 protein [Candidatus Omnitrophica bacterium]|nr:glycosyltransferase family 2 protein [Candidatus Omnitrophota bacterium]